jgi:hypothetical protein
MAYKKNEKKLLEYFRKIGRNDIKQSIRPAKKLRSKPQAD